MMNTVTSWYCMHATVYTPHVSFLYTNLGGYTDDIFNSTRLSWKSQLILYTENCIYLATEGKKP